MKHSLTPSEVKIKLTKIIDNSKTYKRSKNTSFHPLPTRPSSKQLSSNHFLSCQLITAKQFSSIDHQLYKHIITANTPTGSEQNQQSVSLSNSTTNNLIKSINCQYQKHNFYGHKPFLQTTNTFIERQYAGRLTAKDYYKNIDNMNKIYPLQAWKQLSKSYSKMHKQNQHPSFQKSFQNQEKKLNNKSLELLINCPKQNLHNSLYKTEKNLQVQQLIKKWKERQQSHTKLKRQKVCRKQIELQEDIVLRKSFSCKLSSHEFEQNHFNIGSFLTQQNAAQLPEIKQQQSKKHEKMETLPTEINQKNPIFLLHKQPIEQYMEIFFQPTKQIASPKKKPKPLELMRIKSKKLNTRNVECLERLKKNLFRDKTRRDLFARETPKSPKLQQKQHQEIDAMQKTDEGKQSLRQLKNSSQRSSNQSFCRLLNTEPHKSIQIVEKFDIEKQEQEKQEKNQHNEWEKQKIQEDKNKIQEDKKQIHENKDQSLSQTTQLQMQSLKSSRISFGEEPTPQKPRKSLKQHSLINAW